MRKRGWHYIVTSSLPLVSQSKEGQNRGKHEKAECDEFIQVIGLCSVGISVGDETAKTNPEWCYIFHGQDAPFLGYNSE